MDTDIWMPFFEFWFPETDSATLWLYIIIMLIAIGYGSIILYQLIVLRKEDFLSQVKTINELDLLDRALFAGIYGLLAYFFSIFMIRTANLSVNIFWTVWHPFMAGAFYSIMLSLIVAVFMLYLFKEKEILLTLRSAITLLFIVDLAVFVLFYWLIAVSIILARPLSGLFKSQVMPVWDAYLGFIVISCGIAIIIMFRKAIAKRAGRMFN